MRFNFAAEGQAGPDYCKTACGFEPGDETTRCDRCNEPELLPDNVNAVAFFLTVQGQANYAPNGRLLGINYQSAKYAANGLGIRWKKIFPKLRILESELVRINNDAFENDNKD